MCSWTQIGKKSEWLRNLGLEFHKTHWNPVIITVRIEKYAVKFNHEKWGTAIGEEIIGPSWRWLVWVSNRMESRLNFFHRLFFSPQIILPASERGLAFFFSFFRFVKFSVEYFFLPPTARFCWIEAEAFHLIGRRFARERERERKRLNSCATKRRFLYLLLFFPGRLPLDYVVMICLMGTVRQRNGLRLCRFAAAISTRDLLCIRWRSVSFVFLLFSVHLWQLWFDRWNNLGRRFDWIVLPCHSPTNGKGHGVFFGWEIAGVFALFWTDRSDFSLSVLAEKNNCWFYRKEWNS